MYAMCKLQSSHRGWLVHVFDVVVVMLPSRSKFYHWLRLYIKLTTFWCQWYDYAFRICFLSPLRTPMFEPICGHREIKTINPRLKESICQSTYIWAYVLGFEIQCVCNIKYKKSRFCCRCMPYVICICLFPYCFAVVVSSTLGSCDQFTHIL